MICKSTSKNIDLSFYVFPKSEKRKNEWTESVRKVRGKDFVPKLNSYVCSAHFGFNCWTQNGSLKLSAIPTLATLTYQGNYTNYIITARIKMFDVYYYFCLLLFVLDFDE